jgi:ribosomal protein S8
MIQNELIILFPAHNLRILKRVLVFIDKKYQKKVINLSGLVSHIQWAIKSSLNPVIYYSTEYFILLLKILKKYGFIFNYYFIPEIFYKNFLKYNYKTDFYPRLLFIFLKNSKLNVKALTKLKLISKPHRQIYLTYTQLNKLILFKNGTNINIYLLNTTKGLMPHTVALKYKIGGNLLCLVN